MLLDALRDARALLLPVECAGCGAPDRSLCAACAHALRRAPEPRTTPHGLAVVSALRYESAIRRLVLALKEEGRTDVVGALARPLGAAVRAAGVGHPAALVVPVPSSRDGLRRRGYDPVRLLLARAGERPRRMLRPARTTGAQKALGREERTANRRGSLVAHRLPEGAAVLLVDDVLTTGATLDEAARAVREAGGRVVGAATLAFTPRLRGVRDIVASEDYGGD